MQFHLIFQELKQKEGPGFWKFNSSLLEDETYRTTLRDNLTQFKIKYQEVTDLGLKWDLIKMEIRGFTIKYTRNKARLKRNEEKLFKTD